MTRSESALILFTLSPEAEGRRKTLGLGRPERAATLFAALLRHLESLCSNLPGVDLLLASNRDAPQGAGFHLPQRGRSFGESLRLAIEDAFSLGYRRVVVIGNDAPEISRSYLQQAFEALDEAGPSAAVLGAARDGGYALIGLSSPCPQAFEGIPWGTSRVARLTRERLEACGFIVVTLATLEDIDDRRGLARFLARARNGALAHLARRLARVLCPISFNERLFLRTFQKVFLTSWCGLRAPPCAG